MGLPNNVKYSWNVVCNTEGVSEHRVVYPQIAMGKPGSHMMKRLTSGPWGLALQRKTPMTHLSMFIYGPLYMEYTTYIWVYMGYGS